MRFFSLFIAFIPFLFATSEKNDSFIKFEYIGAIDKPVPAVLFFINGSNNFGDLEFVDTFRVSMVEFDSLKHLIESDEKLFLKKRTSFYRVTISSGMHRVYYYIKNKQDTEAAFKKISDKLRRSNQRDRIDNALSRVLSRL